MAQITLKIRHLFGVNVILFLLRVAISAHIIETTPLCGTMDGSSPPKDTDKIYFKDRAQGIRTVEVNGTIYACYPDGTMVDTASSSSSQSAESGETIDDTTLQSRIQSGTFGPLKQKSFIHFCGFLFHFYFFCFIFGFFSIAKRFNTLCVKCCTNYFLFSLYHTLMS